MSAFAPTACSGRVALVTGGGSGIGQEIARQLGLHGAKIVIMGRRQTVLQEAVRVLASDGIDAKFVAGDVRRPEDARAAVDLAVKSYGTLNILVNGAAGNFLSTAENLSTNAFRTVLDIDAVGTFNMSTAAFHALKNNNGVIVNISANLHRHATWYQVHAAAAKAAVDSLTRSLALEWGRFQIRVVGIAPGPTAGTPGMAKLSGGMEDMVSQVVPLGRMGTKAEIGQVVVFVVSSAGAYITGDTILADGGHYLHQDPVRLQRWKQSELQTNLHPRKLHSCAVSSPDASYRDHSGTKSPTQRPQTAVGPRERLEKATATFYRKHHTAADGTATIAPALTGTSPGAASRSCRTIQAWLTGETHAESLRHMQTQVDNDTKALSIKSSNDVALPFDFSQPDLQLLRDALKDRTTMYLRDLYQSFRAFRQSIMSNPSLSPQLDAMFQSSHRFHAQADVLAQLFPGHALDKGRQTAVASLSKHHVMLMLTHCDTDGNSSVDMHVFLHLVQTVAASRETLLSNVFQAIALHAALDNKSANASHPDRVLRILKLVSMVRDVEALKQSRPDTVERCVTKVMEHWKDVNEVNLAANNLVSVPDILFRHWPKLTSLTLHDNRLAALPEALGTCCTNLSVLLCHRNCLTSLPSTVAQLVKLTVATWHHNHLDNIFQSTSTWDGRIFASSLTRSCSATDSTKATSLQRLESVTTFTLAHNRLRHVPAAAAFTSLKVLRVCDLSHNDLHDIQDVDFSTLIACVEVNLRRNRLVHLPSSIFRMANLVHLSVQGNVLVALPQEMATAPSLETVLAHTNHIAKVTLATPTWRH
ncbi:hypothetical protein DYB32_003153 [Aphanomyces invadans]|uniref:2,4-dienoyl-CoA reductase [(3E)-enoyl-CoA-producing] n=1 Tax=Aphanomyces invadans TaxID=157072 RepID=A0A418B1R8_9STRA|nr:hypothetical protein DYB32_003153 [Aphanomyces invadans]